MTLAELWYPAAGESQGWSQRLLGWLLLPISVLFRLLSYCRRLCYRLGWLSQWRSPVPVIVIGNITVGGTGKTPLTIAVAEWLRAEGWRPGIVSRGYGGSKVSQPLMVDTTSDPRQVGDEPLLIARRLQLPVCVHRRRALAIQCLLKLHPDCDIIICDDGLQHYALARDLEFAVVDAARGHGNGRLLPAGPLREPVSRLTSVDLVVWNGTAKAASGDEPQDYYHGVANCLVRLDRQERRTLQSVDGQKCHAIAGIGNPDRFFKLLQNYGADVTPHPFPDHYQYQSKDLEFSGQQPVLMTEKDAVKCESLDLDVSRFWFVELQAELSPSTLQKIESRVETLRG
ncbi:MAG: tetraacyldisaccharide 4'-kinase [Gammaproteobacteria bacterium]|nr:tetraacyldisaccharide 4'-kinase [Gammaproteobacteria bacterium]